jgi:hypothetical protein
VEHPVKTKIFDSRTVNCFIEAPAFFSRQIFHFDKIFLSVKGHSQKSFLVSFELVGILPTFRADVEMWACSLPSCNPAERGNQNPQWE